MSTTEVRNTLQAIYARNVLAASATLPDRLAGLALPEVPDDAEDREALQLAIGSASVAIRSARARLDRAKPELRHYPANVLQALAEHRSRIVRLDEIDAELRRLQDHLAGEG